MDSFVEMLLGNRLSIDFEKGTHSRISDDNSSYTYFQITYGENQLPLLHWTIQPWWVHSMNRFTNPKYARSIWKKIFMLPNLSILLLRKELQVLINICSLIHVFIMVFLEHDIYIPHQPSPTPVEDLHPKIDISMWPTVEMMNVDVGAKTIREYINRMNFKENWQFNIFFLRDTESPLCSEYQYEVRDKRI